MSGKHGAPRQRTPGRKKAGRIIAIVLAVAVVLGGAGVGGYYYLQNSSAAVNVYPLTQLGFNDSWYDRTETEGTVTADRMQSVYLSSTQTVTEIYVEEGQQIKVGDPILAFDTTLSEVELQRAQIKVDQLNLDLKNAENLLKEIDSYRIGTPGGGYYSPTVPDTPKPVATEIPLYQRGEGTAEDPYVFLWNNKQGMLTYGTVMRLLELTRPEETEGPAGTTEPETTDSPEEPEVTGAALSAPADGLRPVGEGQTSTVTRLLAMVLPDVGGRVLRADGDGTDPAPTETVEPTEEPPSQTPEPTAEPTETPAQTPESTPETTPTQAPDDTPEPDAPPTRTPDDTPEPDATPTHTPDATAEPTETPDTTPEPTETPTRFDVSYYMVFEERVNNSMDGDIIRAYEVRIALKDGHLAGVEVIEATYEPYIPERPEVNTGGYFIDTSQYHTAAEVAQMRNETRQLITDKKLELKIAEQELKQTEYELSNGQVICDTAGVVKTVLDPDEARESNQPVVLVSGGGGYYITGVMSEFDLDRFSAGDTVTVYSWMSGEETEGTITEISPFPSEDNYSYYWSSSSNENASKYPFTVMADEDAQLREGDWAYIYLDANGGETAEEEESSGSFFLENAFIRTEGGRSYVYVAGEGDRLEKRYVTTGRSLYGYSTEILDGLNMEEDYIAFPYGRAVKDGAKLEYQDDTSALYSYY